MTRPKLPLPGLRFVVLTRTGTELYRLIPQTTPKGRVMQDLWAVPGGRILNTDELKAVCRTSGWRYRIEGEQQLTYQRTPHRSF